MIDHWTSRSRSFPDVVCAVLKYEDPHHSSPPCAVKLLVRRDAVVVEPIADFSASLLFRPRLAARLGSLSL